MNDASDIAHIIQLAVAPVFLLAGIGAILNVVTSRLGRVVDRARHLEECIAAGGVDVKAADRARSELRVLDKRMAYAQRSIALCCVAALLICAVVVALFTGAIFDVRADSIVAALFIATMVALIFGLSCFLMEVSIATRTLRVRAELFMKDD